MTSQLQSWTSHGFLKYPWLVEHTAPKTYKVFGNLARQNFFGLPCCSASSFSGARCLERQGQHFLERCCQLQKIKMPKRVLKKGWLISHGGASYKISPKRPKFKSIEEPSPVWIRLVRDFSIHSDFAHLDLGLQPSAATPTTQSWFTRSLLIESWAALKSNMVPSTSF